MAQYMIWFYEADIVAEIAGVDNTRMPFFSLILSPYDSGSGKVMRDISDDSALQMSE